MKAPPLVYAFTELNTNVINTNPSSTEPLVDLSTPNLAAVEELGTGTKFSTFKRVAELELADFFSRPQLIASIDIISHTGELDLFKLWSDIPAVAQKLNGYRYFRGCMELTIMYNGNPTCTGTYILSFYPKGYFATTYLGGAITHRAPLNAREANALPNVELNMEEKATVKYCLPYTGPDNGVDLIDKGSNYYWLLGTTTINQVVLNSGLTPVPSMVEFYLSFSEVELHAPILIQGPVLIEGPEMDPSFYKVAKGYAKGLLKQTMPWAFKTPWDMIAQLGDAAAEAMGFSRPLVPPREPVFSRLWSSFSYLSGSPDFGEKLGVDPRVALDVSGSAIPMSKEDDTNIMALVRRWSLLAPQQVDYTVIPVDPACQYSPYDVSAVDGVSTVLGHVSRAFTYWTGSIELKIVFVSNALLRQRYAIYIVPPGIVAPLVYAPGINLVTQLVDVVGRTEVIVNVPYMYVTPFAECEDQLAFFSGDDPMEISKTRVVVMPITQCAGRAGTPHSVAYNTYIRGGVDFSLAVPTTQYTKQYVVVQGPEMNMQVFGENVTDVNQMTRRMCRFGYMGPSAPNTNEGYYFVLPSACPPAGVTSFGGAVGQPVPVLGGGGFSPLWKYFAPMYLGMSGGMRYKVNGFGPSLTVRHVQRSSGLYVDHEFPENNSAPLCISGASPLAEFDLPSQVNTTYVPTRPLCTANPYLAGEETWGFTVERNVNPFTLVSPFSFELYAGTADDYTMKGFVGVPIMRRTA